MPRLGGKWYRGEVRWQVDGAQTASFASHVDDVPVDYTRQESIDLTLSGHPGIQVVTQRDFPWPADTLDRNQSFFVEARLSYDDANAQGAQLRVRIVRHAERALM